VELGEGIGRPEGDALLQLKPFKIAEECCEVNTI